MNNWAAWLLRCLHPLVQRGFVIHRERESERESASCTLPMIMNNKCRDECMHRLLMSSSFKFWRRATTLASPSVMAVSLDTWGLDPGSHTARSISLDTRGLDPGLHTARTDSLDYWWLDQGLNTARTVILDTWGLDSGSYTARTAQMAINYCIIL